GPFPRERVAGPDLRPLLAAAALVVASVAEDHAMLRIPDAVALVSHPRRTRRGLQRRVLDPLVERRVGVLEPREDERGEREEVHAYDTPAAGVPSSMIRLALLALLLIPQDPADSPNLQPPPDAPKEAVEAVDAGAKLMEEARKMKTDPLETVEKAIVEFKKADRLAAKTYPAVHYHLGICYQWTKEYTEARRRLERALEMRPNFHEAMVELGDVCAWLKDYPSAIKTYDRALAMKPDYALAHRNKALSLIRNDDYKAAREALEKATALDGKDEMGKGLLKLVQKELEGPSFGGAKFTRESTHFVVECDADQAFTDWISKNLELITTKYTSIFPQQAKPKSKFRCIVFRDLKEYMASGAPPNTGGYYQDLTKKLVFYRQPKDSDTLLVLYHEAFHQFLAYYLYGAPQWFNEGHGDYFGPSAYNEKTRQMEIRLNPW